MNTNQTGFTLIELMIVVAIIGILASLGIPAYQDYLIRSRINEGLILSAAAKSVIATDATTRSDLTASVNAWNNNSGTTNSKYVSSLIMNLQGEIIITFNSENIGVIASGSSLVFTPYIQTGVGTPVQLATALMESGVTGAIDWGCASSTNVLGTQRNLPALTPGTLQPKYAPSECR